jgi:hypothetical protein
VTGASSPSQWEKLVKALGSEKRIRVITNLLVILVFLVIGGAVSYVLVASGIAGSTWALCVLIIVEVVLFILFGLFALLFLLLKVKTRRVRVLRWTLVDIDSND